LKGVLVIEGHVQGLSNCRSLGKFGIPVWVLDTSDCLAHYSKYCSKFFLCPDFSTEEFVQFLLQIAEENNLRDWLIIPSNDHAVLSISKNKNSLQKYYKIITSDYSIISKIYDKVELLNFAKKLDVPIPEFRLIQNVNNDMDLEFPSLLKGKNGLSFYKIFKRKVFQLNNFEELRITLEKINEKIDLNQVFNQELIPFSKENKTISFTAFVASGEIKTFWIGQKLREHPLRFGTATLAESISDPGIYDSASKLLKALNYTGVCEVEFLKDLRDDQYKLIEINARTWLWVGLADACGINYPKIIYDYVHLSEVNYPKSYEKNILWFNPISNFYFSLIGLFTFQLSYQDFKNNFNKKKINALYTKDDSFPFFLYFFMLLKFKLKR
jgi:D-aspartate ligase